MPEIQQDQYLALMSEIISKQVVILGPSIALVKARNVPELTVSDDGKVTAISGNPEDVLKKLVDQYVELSGLIVKNALGSIFAKYPSIKKID